MLANNSSPKFGFNAIYLVQAALLGVLCWWVSIGVLSWLVLAIMTLLCILFHRRCDAYLSDKVAALHMRAETCLRDGDLETLRAELTRLRWLCWVGVVGDLYVVWAKICAAEQHNPLAVNYVYRALRAGTRYNLLDLQVLLVKLHYADGEAGQARSLSARLLNQYADDMFLRHRLEMILGYESIERCAQGLESTSIST